MTFLVSYKLFITLLIVLRYDNFLITDHDYWILLCQRDSQVLESRLRCKEFFSKYIFKEKSFSSTFNALFADRNIQFAYNGSQQVVVKRLATPQKIQQLSLSLGQDAVQNLKLLYYDENRADGSLLCDGVARFQNAAKVRSEEHFWLYMNLNVQPLILEAFKSSGLPIPDHSGTIGFTSVAKYEGSSATYFVKSSFKTRLRIARILLDGVLQMTDGSRDFRLYLTDLTTDNIAINKNFTRIVFIDLDNVILVNTKATYFKTKEPHRHQKITCKGCFAFSPKDVCSHRLSDLNIFSACQLLNEDLYEDVGKGFLHSMPEHLKEIREKLTDCVNCEGCDRFKIVFELMDLFDSVLMSL